MGALDNLVNERAGKFLAKVLSARLFHREDAGHGLAEQYEEEVNKAIEAIVEAGEEAKATAKVALSAPPGQHPWPCYAGAVALAFAVWYIKLPYCNSLVMVALLLVVLVTTKFLLE